jgi:hypothetical protein
VGKLESDIQGKIKEWLEERSCIVNKLTTIGAYGTKGFPDLCVFMPLRRVWLLEVKKPGEHPDSIQSYWIDRLERYDYHVDVVHSLAEVKDLYQLRYDSTIKPKTLDGGKRNVRSKISIRKKKKTVKKKTTKKKGKK